MNRIEASDILESLVESESLRRHCRSIALVMEAYAHELGEDPDTWYITGLLHDADYEKYPEQHPEVIVGKLRDSGHEAIAHAISAHHTRWGKPYTSNLDKYLLAVDELTGFIVAVSYMRPGRMEGMSVSSVTKKLKTKGFAEGVDREEIDRALEIASLEKEGHINFIIRVLTQNQVELGLV